MNNLPREQSVAFNKLLLMLQCTPASQNCARLNKNSPLLPSGFVAHSHIPFDKTKIPREKFWAWNQSNRKKTVQLTSSMVVTFRKITPRKRYSDQTAPKFKIWVYHCQSLNSPDQYYLWCEKGAGGGIETEIGLI